MLMPRYCYSYVAMSTPEIVRNVRFGKFGKFERLASLAFAGAEVGLLLVGLRYVAGVAERL